MGEQRNLTEENIQELKKELERMKAENPDLEYRFFEQDGKEELHPTNKDIMDELQSIRRRLDNIKHIFDGHVLINGKFKKIEV